VRWTLDTDVERIRRRLFPPYKLGDGGQIEERAVNAHRERGQVRRATLFRGPLGLFPAAVERFAVVDGSHAWRPIVLAEAPAGEDQGDRVTAHLQLPEDGGLGPRYHVATAATLGGQAQHWRLYLALCLAWFAEPPAPLDAEDLRAICFGRDAANATTARQQRGRAVVALRTLAEGGIVDVHGPERGPWTVRPAREDRAHPGLAGVRLADL